MRVGDSSRASFRYIEDNYNRYKLSSAFGLDATKTTTVEAEIERAE